MPPASTVRLPVPEGTGSIKPMIGPDLAANIIEFFRWGVLMTTVLAVIFLVIVGFQYTTTESFGNKSLLRKRIQEILLGLALSVSSVMILEAINPRILLINYASIGASGTSTIGSVDANLDVDKDLITVNGERDIYGSVEGKDGKTITVQSGVRIDTDGKNPPPFNDPHYQDETSLPGLDANVDNYVVVPIGSKIPLGSQVYVYNHTTGKGVMAQVGDRGPTQNGFGEMSLAAAREIGSWRDGMGNSALPHVITYTFYE